MCGVVLIKKKKNMLDRAERIWENRKYRLNFDEVDVALAKNDKLTKWKSDKN